MWGIIFDNWQAVLDDATQLVWDTIVATGRPFLSMWLGEAGTAPSLPQGLNISKCFKWVATRERAADAIIIPCTSTSPSNQETIKTTCPYIQLDELSTENDIEVIFEQVYFWTG